VDRARQIERLGLVDHDAGPRIETYEFGVPEQLLAAIFAAAQQSEKPTQFPQPRTAWDVLKREKAHKAWEDVLDLVQLVPQDEYDAMVAEKASNEAATVNR
jgi:hypothetical protein